MRGSWPARASFRPLLFAHSRTTPTGGGNVFPVLGGHAPAPPIVLVAPAVGVPRSPAFPLPIALPVLCRPARASLYICFLRGEEHAAAAGGEAVPLVIGPWQSRACVAGVVPSSSSGLRACPGPPQHQHLSWRSLGSTVVSTAQPPPTRFHSGKIEFADTLPARLLWRDVLIAAAQQRGGGQFHAPRCRAVYLQPLPPAPRPLTRAGYQARSMLDLCAPPSGVGRTSQRTGRSNRGKAGLGRDGRRGVVAGEVDIRSQSWQIGAGEWP